MHITQRKRPIGGGHVPRGVPEKAKLRHAKIGGCQRFGREGQVSGARGVQTVLCGTVMMDARASTRLSKPTEGATPRRDPRVNQGLRATPCQRGPVTVAQVSSGEGCGARVCVGAGGIWKVSVLSTQFC